jgi:transposase
LKLVFTNVYNTSNRNYSYLDSYKDSCINKFIASLKTDLEAVINAASYGISNGITEGSVNKIKQIKIMLQSKSGDNLLTYNEITQLKDMEW